MMHVILNITNSGLYCGHCGKPLESTTSIPKYCPNCSEKLWVLE